MFAFFVAGNCRHIIIKWVGLPELGGSIEPLDPPFPVRAWIGRVEVMLRIRMPKCKNAQSIDDVLEGFSSS